MSADGEPALVRCENAWRTYGADATEVVALADVTCAIVPGARVAVAGPSGSGKSTLLALMAGLATPSRGSVRWPALGPRSALAPGRVAVVFQGPSLMEPLTVLENVAFPLLLAGVPADVAIPRARSALSRLALADLTDRLPEEISGGQAQRAAVARAVAGDARLILADEPTGQLDAAGRDLVLDALLHAADVTGAGLVVATHDAAVLGRLPAQITLHDGRLVEPAGEAACTR